MWLVCCGMPRSGSTLQYQICADLVENAGIGKRIGWCRPADFPKLRSHYIHDQRLIVVKSHIASDEIIREFELKNALGVYIFRDIRDVVLSHIKKYSCDFNDILRIHFIEKWLDNYTKWIKLENVLISKYEVVVSDLPAEVMRISEHIGLALTREQCLEIASKYSLKKQLNRIKKFKKTLSRSELNATGSKSDPHSLLHTNHIFSGKSGGWRTHLTRDQIGIIEEKAGKWLETNGYQLSKTK